MSGLQDVKDVLHEIVTATAGSGTAERLHGLIDELGAAAEPAPAEPEPAAEPFPAPAETAPPTAAEPGWTAF